MSTRKVLVTGSAGVVGQAVAKELLARGHAVRGLDLRPTPGIDDHIVTSLTEREALDRACAGMDTVCHLAAVPDDADFMTKLLPANIIGLYNILEAAKDAGVKRMVLTSSGQAMNAHAGPWPATIDMPTTPNNWYAVLKVMQEEAGKMYALRHKMEVVALRLGWCPRTDRHVQMMRDWPFGRAMYLSNLDAGRLYAAAVESPKVTGFTVCFGTSIPDGAATDPGPVRFDIQNAREVLGFEPKDTWPDGVKEWLERLKD